MRVATSSGSQSEAWRPRDGSPAMTNNPRHTPSGTAPEYSFREHRFRFLATGQDTGGTYSAMEIVSPLDSGPGPHVHADAEEHFLLLDGEIVFSVDDQTFTV